jgi:peptidoglycan/xylan/chitin deacetylase (PgdA/CDA1 family)
MNDVLVLCYHSLSETWPAALSIEPDVFEQHLDLLVKRGYVGATFERAITDPPAPRTVAVTFDDAFRSVKEIAAPIMRRLGLPGSIYVPTNFPGRPGPMAWDGTDDWVGGPHEHELACLGWDELGELADEGWEVGAHTCSHPRLTRLTDAELAHELEGSRAACSESLGRPCRTMAYPYGDVDGRVRDAVDRAGYAVAAGLPDRRLGALDSLDWPRLGVYRGDDRRRFRIKISRPVRRARSTAIWAAAVERRRREVT